MTMQRHPLIWFFVLAYALSWWAWIPYELGVLPNPVASFGPTLAALIMLALTRGKSGVLGLLRRMIRWRVAPGRHSCRDGCIHDQQGNPDRDNHRRL